MTEDSLQSTDKDQQESRAVAGKLHVYNAVVKFDTYIGYTEIYSFLVTIKTAAMAHSSADGAIRMDYIFASLFKYLFTYFIVRHTRNVIAYKGNCFFLTPQCCLLYRDI